MTIYPDKQDIAIVIFLLILSVLTALLFFFQFNSLILSCLILLFLAFAAIRYWVAFGRTISFDSNGIQISLWMFKRHLDWNQIHKIALFDTRKTNAIGYKEVAKAEIEFFSFLKPRPPTLSPATYCLYFHPWSYIFLSFAESVVQPKGVKYPVHYQVEKENIVAFLESNNIPIEGLSN